MAQKGTQPMRILILSCNTGEGHNSCAKALKEVFDSKGHYCSIEDALCFISHSASKFVSNGHTLVYRHLPGLFRWGYRHMEKNPKAYRDGTILNNYFSSGKQRLAKFIDTGDFDVVISTHVIVGFMLTGAKKLCHTDFYTAFVGTDYTCSPTTEMSDLDVYFIPDDALKKDFTDCGIPESKLVSSGIPVRQMFYTDIEKSEAKTLEGINEKHTHLLVMSGSMGCGHIDSLVFLISKDIAEDEYITIVCGTNKRMQRRLTKRYRNSPNIRVKGYVNNVSRLMDSADLYLTKPGGISVSEAKQKRLPMVFVDAVAGCEEYNRHFFVSRGCALSGKNIIYLSKQCVSLLREAEKRLSLEQSYDVFERKNSAQYICNYLNDRVMFRSSPRARSS